MFVLRRMHLLVSDPPNLMVVSLFNGISTMLHTLKAPSAVLSGASVDSVSLQIVCEMMSGIVHPRFYPLGKYLVVLDVVPGIGFCVSGADGSAAADGLVDKAFVVWVRVAECGGEDGEVEFDLETKG
jgi:hypothetical protein